MTATVTKRSYAAIMSPLSATLFRSAKQKAVSVVEQPRPLEPAPPPSAQPVYALSLHAIMNTPEEATAPPPPPPPPAPAPAPVQSATEPHGAAIYFLKEAFDRLALLDGNASAGDLAEMFCSVYAGVQRKVHSTLLPETRLTVDRKLDIDLRKMEVPQMSPVELPFGEDDWAQLAAAVSDDQAPPPPPPPAYHAPPSQAVLDMLRAVGRDDQLRVELIDRLHHHVNDVFFGALRHHRPIESEPEYRSFFPASQLPGAACAGCRMPQSVFHARVVDVCPSICTSFRPPCRCPPVYCVGCDVEIIAQDLLDRLLRAPSEAWDCALQCRRCSGCYCPFSAFNTTSVVAVSTAAADSVSASHDEIQCLQEGVVAAVASDAPPNTPLRCTCYGTLERYRPGALGDISEEAAANFGMMRIQPPGGASPGARQTHTRHCPLSTSHQRPRARAAAAAAAAPMPPPPAQPTRGPGRPRGSSTVKRRIKTEKP